MYNLFEIELQFREKVYGGLPKDEEALKAYVKAAFQSEDTSPTADDLDLQEETDKRTVGFKKDDIGVYVGTYQLKAMLGEAASLLEFTVKKRGSKQTFKEGLNIKGMNDDGDFTGEQCYFLPLKKEIDGTEMHTGNVSTPMGNRSIIKTLEFVEKPRLKFQISILENRMGEGNTKKLTVTDFKLCLAHARELGLGSHRKYQAGKFDIKSFKQLDSLSPEDVIDF